MSTMARKSMMWRTTTAFGAFGFGLVLAYLGFLFGNDPAQTVALRVFAGTTLTVGAFACMSKGLRELRGK